MTLGSMFSILARTAARLTGHPGAFLCAVWIVLIWGLSGPMFGFSDTWQLVINTGTTIVTFLMVFLIQNSQNRDTVAIHLKLDELIRSIKEARNSAINLEDLEEADLKGLLAQYRELAKSEADIPSRPEIAPAGPAAPEKDPA
ncbi:MAG TPA: low affinity iron permease family protein [Planctomycetaceae bacterium]